MVPIVAGLLMGAAMGGGIAALQKKDILQGALMGGIGGALGGAFMPAAGVAGAAGEGAISASTAAAGNPGTFIAADQAATQAANAAASSTPGIGSIVHSANPATTSPGLFSGGFGNFVSANKYPLIGGLAGGMMAPGKEPEPADQGNIYSTTFSQERNPEFGKVAGAAYFKPQQYSDGTYTKVGDYNPTMAATGGLVALAEGGQALELAPYRPVETNRYSAPVRAIHPAITDYNAQLLQRADQQYNKNLRPLPNQVPGSPGYVAPTFSAAAPAAAPTGGISYDPVTRRYIGLGGLAQKEKSELEKMREEMAAIRAEQGGSMAGDSGNANGGMIGYYADGGLSSLGSYSDGGRLLKGPGDGVSDDIPAQIGDRQPARLADGEFVVPARIVSEIGNGSTEAGAKRLYAMMDRVQKQRGKTVGKGKVAVDSKAHTMLPA